MTSLDLSINLMKKIIMIQSGLTDPGVASDYAMLEGVFRPCNLYSSATWNQVCHSDTVFVHVSKYILKNKQVRWNTKICLPGGLCMVLFRAC